MIAKLFGYDGKEVGTADLGQVAAVPRLLCLEELPPVTAADYQTNVFRVYLVLRPGTADHYDLVRPYHCRREKT